MFKYITVATLGFFLVFNVVTVPLAHATTFEGIVGRLAFRSLAPSVVMGMGGGMGIVAGVVIGGGIGYILLKSGAISALKNWWNSGPGLPTQPSTGDFKVGTGTHAHLWWSAYYNDWTTNIGMGETCPKSQSTSGPCPTLNTWWVMGVGNNYSAAYQAFYGTPVPPVPAPTVPTDYAAELAGSQPDFQAGQVYGTPGVAAALTGGATIVSSQVMSDSDIDKMVTGLGGSEITDTGSQAGNPAATDNTVTSGDAAQISLLDRIMNFVSNLVGIKADTSATRTAAETTAVQSTASRNALDNAVVLMGQQSGKMDNMVTGIGSLNRSMDNVAINSLEQTRALEGVSDNIASLTEGVTTTTATVQTLSTRIDSLRDVAATKFPFSVVLSVSVPSPGDYSFGSLPLPGGHSIPINPLAGPFHDFIIWARQLLVYMFWAMTLAAILKKSMLI